MLSDSEFKHWNKDKIFKIISHHIASLFLTQSALLLTMFFTLLLILEKNYAKK